MVKAATLLLDDGAQSATDAWKFGHHNRKRLRRMAVTRILAQLSLILGLVGCNTVTHLGKRPDFSKISMGMPQSQVVEIMGKPESIHAQNGMVFLIYTFAEWYDHNGADGTKVTYFVRLIEDKVESYGEKGDLALFPVAASGAPRPQAPIEPEPKPARPKKIQVGTGTGFVIDSHGKIATCYHVVADATKIECVFFDGKRRSARLISGSRATDVAILQVDATSLVSLPLSTKCQQGDAVFAMGFPAPGLLGVESKYTEGVVSSLSGLGGDGMSMQISVPIQPGSSGSPLVHAESRAVVGVVTSTAAVGSFWAGTGTIPQNVNWAVKSNAIEALVEVDPKTQNTTDGELASIRKAICRIEVVSSAQ
jgi:S1-C subfamily serine protease